MLALSVALAVVFFVGGGWYFSGQIYNDGLKVNPSTPSYGQEVVAVGKDTVSIADRGDEQPVLDGHDVWGLRWRAASGAEDEVGYGQITGDGTGSDNVTRQLTVMTGRPPVPGDKVDLDRSAFPEDTTVALGQPAQEVRYGSAEYPAWYVPGTGSRWAVLVHGKGESRSEMLRLMRSTVKAGLPSLAITYRNDPGVTQDPSAMYQYGRTEWHDLDAAVGYALDNGADDVVLVGASMGGATIASYLRHVPNAPVSALVLDAPMLDFGETVSYGASQRSLPLFGHVPEALTWTAKQIAARRYGVRWSQVDYIHDSGWLHVPTLVVHGDADKTAPLDLSQQLKAAHPALVSLVVFPGAGHVASWNADPARYDAMVTGFLNQG